MTDASGQWIDVLEGSMGKYIAIETLDGIIRQGKISGFKYRFFQFNGTNVAVPTDIELNGDMNDDVPIVRIGHLTIS